MLHIFGLSGVAKRLLGLHPSDLFLWRIEYNEVEHMAPIIANFFVIYPKSLGFFAGGICVLPYWRGESF